MNTCYLIISGIVCTIGVSECLECFNCLNIEDPKACTNTVQCSNNESCFLQTVHSGNVVRYNMGCQNDQFCNSLAVDHNGIIGRSIQTRQQYSCHECCSSNRCNEHLCANRKPTSCIDDETLDCARLNSIFAVCADIHHAKTTCPKFCGLCQLVDGNWADWGHWSKCSATCNNGTQTRVRSCTNPAPANSGLSCSGPAVESNMCQSQLCPVNGNWSGWSTWSGCSVTCDVGLRKKTRTCTNPKPDPWGDYCVGESSEYTICLNEPCGVINDSWSSWGAWESCAVTCGVGLKFRHRTCRNLSPSTYSKTCAGEFKDFAVCVNTPCNVIAFNVHGFNLLANLVNAFPTVIFNEGNAYNASTGQFTAPVSGLYYFSVQICLQTSASAEFYMQTGNANMSGVVKLTATFQTSPGNGACTSQSSFVKLLMNERVWVLMARQYSTAFIWEEPTQAWNTFTGALIQEL
ncbi:A disintegrin and metalloproteinase with thrombospondin motifs adt-2-like [Dreissena polymorpha]|nr:A disintegrin and metalloproteinase with thrombospondin motifs adt-2-like [Dreissena polymorpha]